MPAVASGKILVTGANGYVAIWVVRSLLEHGYSVRATVRSENKGTYLQKYFSKYGDKLELVVVPDITAVGAFDEAVKGVDAIEHTASPFHFKAEDPDELIIPAVNGTTRVLESALKYGTSVKRVVITSSCASVFTAQDTPRTFTEVDWNDRAINEVKTKGRDAHPGDKYCASKTMAERSAWEFVEKNKGKLTWDLVVLNPPYVFGPAIQEVSSPEALNESMHSWFHNVFKTPADIKFLSSFGSEWIDVRDLGLAHVLVIQKEQAGGERFIVSSGPWKWQDWLNSARKFYSEVPEGDKSYDPKTTTYMIRYNTAKAAKVLGIKYITMDECSRDSVEDFKAKGWVKA